MTVHARQDCASGRRARVVLTLLVAMQFGCDHTPPFAPPGLTDLGPRGPGNPVRVTYSPGDDTRPSWLPDGSGFFYTVERIDREDGDQCLARMAAAGGTMLEIICDRSVTTDDSIATFEWAAVASDDRLAYVRTGTPLVPATLAPRTVELRLGTRTEPSGDMVRAFPYTAPSGRIHQSLEWLQWFGTTELLYLAEEVSYPRACSSCPPDTLRTGLEVVTLDAGLGVLAIVPGTDLATSVAVAGTDTIYYTLPFSNVIQRRIHSNGVVSVAATFPEPVRDVAAGGGRLAAITGLGALWLVNPGVPAQPLTALTLTDFKRPAVSPTGAGLVVEGYAVQMDTIRVNGVIVAINRIVSTSADLWYFALP